MTAKTKIALGLAICVALVGVFIGVTLRGGARESAVQLTRVRLFTYAGAVTNYFQTVGEWPRSLADLRSNKLNIAFLAVEPSARDEFGNIIQYEPYNGILGYGALSSRGSGPKNGPNNKGFVVRFSITNVIIEP
jgi:hypothetical protein